MAYALPFEGDVPPWVAGVARLAVFRPALGDRTSTEAEAPGQFARLADLWKSRVVDLGAAGWSRVSTPGDLAQVGACEPFQTCPSFSHARCCSWLNVCPFCHGRAVLASAWHVGALLAKGRPAPATIVAFRSSYESGDACDVLREWDLAAHSAAPLPASRGVAGAVAVVSPFLRDGAPGYGLTRCGFLYYPGGVPSPAAAGPGWAFEAQALPATTDAFAAAAPDVYRYAPDLLLAPPADAVRLIALRACRALTKYHGDFAWPVKPRQAAPPGKPSKPLEVRPPGRINPITMGFYRAAPGRPPPVQCPRRRGTVPRRR